MLSHKFKSAKLSYGWIIVAVSAMIVFAASSILKGWLFDMSGSYGTAVWLVIWVVLVSTAVLAGASKFATF